jgi:hypothetical protein
VGRVIRRGAVIALGVVSAAGLLYVRAVGPSEAPTTQFTENGVTVTLTVRSWDGTRGTLAVIFTPDKPGYHLYSADLPPGGMNGVGRPIAVTAQGQLTATSRLTTTAVPHGLTIAGTGLTLPVYPDGPVTTDLPIEAAGPGSASFLVSYAACSASDCLIPVSGHAVAAVVSQGSVAFGS